MQDTYEELTGVVIARLAGVDDRGRPLVQDPRSDDGPRAARVVWMRDTPDWSRLEGARVVIAYEEAASDQPILMALLDPPPELEMPLPGGTTKTLRAPRDLRIESGRELVIECGKAKIALRSDGRIEIRGGHLISRSSGPNHVQGGSVHIN